MRIRSVYFQPSVLTPTMKLMAAEFGYHITSTSQVTICGSGWDNATPTLRTHGIFRNSVISLNLRQYDVGC